MPLPPSPPRARNRRSSRLLLGLAAVLPLFAGARAVHAATPARTAAATAPAKTPLNTLAEPTAFVSGALDPAALDPDADGVPSSNDNCPFVPNPPQNGKQPSWCGHVFSAAGKGYTFLKSRVLAPAPGLDKNTKLLDPSGPAHLILHLKGAANGALLPPARRAALEKLGVKVLGYLPDDAFYVSLVPSTSNLNALLAVDGIAGLTVRLPSDRVAPALRVRGPLAAASDKSFEVEVEFFDDVPKATLEATLANLTLKHELLFDATYRVRVASWQALERLASVDAVKWIDEPDDGEIDDFTLNAQAVIAAEPVAENYGYRGAGLTVAMMEKSSLWLNPENPDMAGRLTIGNIPTFAYPESQHAWNVASILIADETSFPENMGLLPDAELVSFAVDKVQTRKRRYFGLPKDAREDYDALLMNNSWGDYRCSKIGEYTGHAKWRDRAIVDLGIIMVDGAGNGRFAESYPAEGCPRQDFSLGLVNAKNSIMVGNWSLVTGALDEGSSIGPAADGRLKPDLVAPGGGVDTLDFNITELVDVDGTGTGGLEAPEYRGETSPTVFGGTSAAAPVVSGVVGWIAEAFAEQGWSPLSLPPARVKAILVHTARDVGLPGPDFSHGYGLVQAGPALRIAQEWGQWGREHTFDEEGELFEFTVEIPESTYAYKVTLAWDDVEGEDTSDKALKNDLDLTLVSPTGSVVYRPFDLRYPLGSGLFPAPACTADPCDDRNNVEQVIARNAGGAPLEPGPWTVRVNARRLVSDEQHMSLVLTPPCPVVIDQDVTLAGPVNCTPHPLEPAAVKVTAPGVTLDCNDQEIAGAVGDAAATRDYVGIAIAADDVTVEDCILSRFDKGIAIGDAETPISGVSVYRNQLYEMRHRGIDVWGDENTVSLNLIADMQRPANAGIHVRGDRNLVTANQLRTSGAETPRGIQVGKGCHQTVVSANFLSGTWEPAILFASDDEAEPITRSHAVLNVMHEISGVGVMFSGAIHQSTIDGSIIRYYGPASPAILVEANNGLAPNDIDVLANVVLGSELATQTGIHATGTGWTRITGNIVTDVAVGIHDEESDSSWIKNNLIFSLDTTTPQFRGIVGVLRRGGTVTQIQSNFVDDALSGVSVVNSGAEQLFVRGNGVHVLGLGVSVVGGNGADISGNPVEAGVTGIALFGGADATITGNVVTGFDTAGIYAWNAPRLTAASNTITDVSVLAGPTTTTGFHYASGIGAALKNNIITSNNAGVGIKLGMAPAPCATLNVENATLQGNTFTGVSSEVLAGCDVGPFTNTP